MDIGQQVAALGADQEGDHRDDDEQSFETFAQQDGEGAEESGGGAARLRTQRGFGLAEQGQQPIDVRGDVRRGRRAPDRGAKAAHFPLDLGDEPAVAGG